MLALRLHDILRFKYRMNYEDQCEMYRKANNLDVQTAKEEWEDHMQEAEEVASWS